MIISKLTMQFEARPKHCMIVFSIHILVIEASPNEKVLSTYWRWETYKAEEPTGNQCTPLTPQPS
jgi:hypothetical protein